MSAAQRAPARRPRRPGGVAAAGPGWRLAATVVALGVLVPLAWLFVLALGGDAAHWRGLVEHVLPVAARNTAVLLAGVGLVALVIGTGCAWLVTTCDFPGRRILHWALLLPLAMPTYVVAYAWLDLLHPIGPIQGALRWLLGFDSPRQFRLPDARAMPTAVAVLGLVLYPYVYLSARAMFGSLPAHLMEAARTLGESRAGAFMRVALPLARPGLAVGLSLALLEALNDIGASEFLGVQTMTVSVYTTWVTRSDLPGAAQIACTMLAVVVLLVWLERRGRGRRRYGSVQRMRALRPRPLAGAKRWLATAVAALPVLLGFVLPAAWLASAAWKRLREGAGLSDAYLAAVGNSLRLATGVTVVAVGAGLVVAWAMRDRGVPGSRHRTGLPGRLLAGWQRRAATLGYAVPGTVLAIGLLPPALAVDAGFANMTGLPGLPLMSAGVILVAGCAIRFLAMPTGTVDAGLARIPQALELSARLLGESATGVLRRVHLPLLRPALATSALLVFIDAMKELPATLLLRPAQFETLATLLYAEAARGTYEEGALAALTIVAAGLPSVALLARTQLGGSTPVPVPASAIPAASAAPPARPSSAIVR